MQTQKHLPRDRCLQSLLLYSALESSLCPGFPPLLENIWLMRAVQAEPECSFPNHPCSRAEFPPQIRPSSAMLPLSRPSPPSMRTSVDPHHGQSPHFRDRYVLLWRWNCLPKSCSQVCPCKDCCQLTTTVTLPEAIDF